MIAYFEPSPNPNTMIINGSNPTFGIGKVASTIGFMIALTTGNNPMPSPSANPDIVPMENPMKMRLTLISVLSKSSPD